MKRLTAIFRAPQQISKNKNKKKPHCYLPIDVPEEIGSALFNDSDVFAALYLKNIQNVVQSFSAEPPRFLSQSPGAPYGALWEPLY